MPRFMAVKYLRCEQHTFIGSNFGSCQLALVVGGGVHVVERCRKQLTKAALVVVLKSLAIRVPAAALSALGLRGATAQRCRGCILRILTAHPPKSQSWNEREINERVCRSAECSAFDGVIRILHL